MNPGDKTCDAAYCPVPAQAPTSVPAGSKAKVEAMRLRVERGEDIWHPDDPHCFRERFPWSLPLLKDPGEDTEGEA